MQTHQLSTEKGYPIGITEFASDNQRSAIVIISPATGVRQRYYFKFAQYLQSKGFTTITFDFGGIGESRNKSLKHFDTSALNWGRNDLEAVIQYAVRQYPQQALHAIGHSIGGQLIGLAPSAKHLSKVLLVASQSGFYQHWSGFNRLKMMTNWYLIFPLLTNFFGYFPGKKLGVMEDLPKSMALEWTKWCKSTNYLFDHIDKGQLHFEKLKGTVTSYSAVDDKYAPKAAVDWITKQYSEATISRIELVPNEQGLSKIGHFGFFKERMKDSFWQMLLAELKP